jgi:hypothetical protein
MDVGEQGSPSSPQLIVAEDVLRRARPAVDAAARSISATAPSFDRQEVELGGRRRPGRLTTSTSPSWTLIV